MSLISWSPELSKSNQFTSHPYRKPLHRPPKYNSFINVCKYNRPYWRSWRRRWWRRNWNRYGSPTLQRWYVRSALSVFDGTRSNANEFWAQFRRYKLVNQMHDSMTKPFNQVLTTLTYIRGPMINDWVNAQEEYLANRVDPTKRGWVRENDEVLWQEFEAKFKAAWTDTSKKQNAYNQLMKLTMQGWDVDTYIATFDHLALAAGWDLNSEGTIVCF
jgi:hypothetical protein